LLCAVRGKVRLPDSDDGFFELVAGARRYRASKIAKRETIPATVRELTDAECLELQLIELSVVRKSFLR
jgi:ParB family chromosome partitioning protein